MALGVNTVTQAMTSSGRAVEAASDEALIAEISPDMQEKLRKDHRQRFLFSGALLILVATQTWGPGGTGTIERLVSDALLIICSTIGLIAIGKGIRNNFDAYGSELTYRRLHGKWRWER
jgi:hypothetical protein